jgi:hypothetical protein
VLIVRVGGEEKLKSYQVEVLPMDTALETATTEVGVWSEEPQLKITALPFTVPLLFTLIVSLLTVPVSDIVISSTIAQSP